MRTATKERPILFSAPMVNAIIAGRKTQTRRVLKRQPPPCKGFPRFCNDEWGVYTDRPHAGPYMHIGKCPYGEPGDLLWVRETFYCDDYTYPNGNRDDLLAAMEYKASHCCADWEAGCPCSDKAWKPSIHMPRWASRITLEVTDVRVERLREITPGDAEREGIAEYAKQHNLGGYWTTAFARLWDELNGPRGFGWDANPWVWVVSFTTQEPTR